MDTYVYYSNMLRTADVTLDAGQIYPCRIRSFEETKSDYRRSEIYSASILLRKAFGSLYGRDFDIYIDEYGKPHAVNDEVFFNISHSEGIVMVAVSDCRVGVDIQYAVDKTDYEKLAKRFFSENEQKNVSNSPEKAQIFYKYWTYRESYCKMNGKGLARLNDKILIDEDEIYLEGKKVPCRITGGKINNYYYSVCTEKESEVHLEQIDIQR